jgi:heme/copper-type cytochrome/quinol oxidase subunit 1
MIKFISTKPYFLFLALILIIFTWGFIDAEQNLVFNVEDTYFVIKRSHLAVILSVIYGFLAFVYFIIIKLNFKLIRWVTVLHTLVTIICILLLYILFQLIRENKPYNFENIISDMYFNERMLIGIWGSIYVSISIQFLFLINVIYALIKGRT